MHCRFFNVVSVDVFCWGIYSFRHGKISFRRARQTCLAWHMRTLLYTEVHFGLSRGTYRTWFLNLYICIHRCVFLLHINAFCIILFYVLHLLKLYILSRIILNHFLASAVVVSVICNGVALVRQLKSKIHLVSKLNRQDIQRLFKCMPPNVVVYKHATTTSLQSTAHKDIGYEQRHSC